MRLDKFFVSVVILLFMLTGGILLIGNEDTQYDLGIDKTSERTFPNTARAVEMMQNATSDVKGPLIKGGKFKLADTFNWVLSAGYQAISFVWDMLSIPFIIASDFYALLQIPPAITLFFKIGVYTAIVFTIIFLYFRFQPR